MNTSVEQIERNTALEEVKKNTASGSLYNSEHFRENSRREAEQSYKAWVISNLEKDVELSELSMVLADISLFPELHSRADYVRGTPLLMLEKKGQLKPILLSGYSPDALAELGKIIVTPGQLPRLEQEEKELAGKPPDEYFVEGIHIDWKSAFTYHEKLNKLRKKHGIREI